MCSPQKRLFSALFCVLLAFSGLYAAADCELLLQSAFAKVTEKALLAKQISSDDLLALVLSDVPINPLKNQTRVSSNSSLNTVFALLVEQCSKAGTWETVRSELKALLGTIQVDQVQSAQASKATAEILAPMLVTTQSGFSMDDVKWFCTSRGRCLFLFRDPRTGVAEVREVQSNEPLWRESKAHQEIHDPYPWNFSENEKGEPLMLYAGAVRASKWEFLRYAGREKYLLTAENLETGEKQTKVFFPPPGAYANRVYGSTDGSVVIGNSHGKLAKVDGTMLKMTTEKNIWDKALENTNAAPIFVSTTEYGVKIWLKQLRKSGLETVNIEPIVLGTMRDSARRLVATDDGKISFAYAKRIDESMGVGYSPPFVSEPSTPIDLFGGKDKISDIQIVSGDGRTFVIAVRMGEEQSVDIYEPAVSTWPLTTIPLGRPATGHASVAGAFLRAGRLFVAAGARGGGLGVYEPLISPTSRIGMMPLGVNERFQGLKTDETGQVYAIVSDLNLNARVYSLFHMIGSVPKP